MILFWLVLETWVMTKPISYTSIILRRPLSYKNSVKFQRQSQLMRVCQTRSNRKIMTLLLEQVTEVMKKEEVPMMISILMTFERESKPS